MVLAYCSYDEHTVFCVYWESCAAVALKIIRGGIILVIIGELINSSRKAVGPAVDNRDAAFIQDLARKQVEAGATYVDVNAGTHVHDEAECLTWLAEVVQDAVDAPLCLDSPNPDAIKAAIKVCKKQVLINSISAEKDRFDRILPLVTEYNARVVGLCMDDTGMPETAEDRIRVADFLVENMTKAGVKVEDMFLDPLVKPISVNISFGNEVLDAMRAIHTKYPGIHTTCGLSNVSFGLPNRKLLNQAFFVMCVANGMDGVIMDPLDPTIMDLAIASDALVARDEYCMSYITRQRNK
jgi:5-methyltetrahydrofolate--homocysteine methyltransferase